MAERSKGWVCSRSAAGIAGSNPADGMDVWSLSCVCQVEVRFAISEQLTALKSLAPDHKIQLQNVVPQHGYLATRRLDDDLLVEQMKLPRHCLLMTSANQDCLVHALNFHNIGLQFVCVHLLCDDHIKNELGLIIHVGKPTLRKHYA